MSSDSTQRGLAEKLPAPRERDTQRVFQELWLTYYNDTLFRRGTISETEYHRMRLRIRTRSVS